MVSTSVQTLDVQTATLNGNLFRLLRHFPVSLYEHPCHPQGFHSRLDTGAVRKGRKGSKVPQGQRSPPHCPLGGQRGEPQGKKQNKTDENKVTSTKEIKNCEQLSLFFQNKDTFLPLAFLAQEFSQLKRYFKVLC